MASGPYSFSNSSGELKYCWQKYVEKRREVFDQPWKYAIKYQPYRAVYDRLKSETKLMIVIDHVRSEILQKFISKFSSLGKIDMNS